MGSCQKRKRGRTKTRGPPTYAPSGWQGSRRGPGAGFEARWPGRPGLGAKRKTGGPEAGARILRFSSTKTTDSSARPDPSMENMTNQSTKRSETELKRTERLRDRMPGNHQVHLLIFPNPEGQFARRAPSGPPAPAPGVVARPPVLRQRHPLQKEAALASLHGRRLRSSSSKNAGGSMSGWAWAWDWFGKPSGGW